MATPDFDAFIDSKTAEIDGADTGTVEGAGSAPVVEDKAPVVEDTFDVDADLPEGTDMFPRAAMERVRKEAAKHRTELKRFKEAFDGYEESDQEALFQLAQQLRNDPKAAAEEMRKASEDILSRYADENKSVLDELGIDDSDYMTKADFLKMREAEAVERELRSIESEARSLGYKPGTADYRFLMLTAEEGNGDIAAAHAKIEARNQAVIDAYVAKKAADAQETPKAPVSGGGAPTTSEPMDKSFAGARARLEEFIRNN